MEETQEIGIQKYLALMNRVDNDFAALLTLSETQQDIIDQCLDPDLEPIWEIIWAKMNAQPTFQEAQKDNSLKYRPLKPQPFLHPFYRVAGLHYFHRGYKPGHRELLLKAASPPYQNFQALRCLAEEIVKQEKKGGYHFARAISHAKTAADVHHAPGYILLAETHFTIACFYNEKNSHISDEHFKQALLNLVIADELQPHCANSMHNAYYGLGPKISNGFGIETTSELRKHLLAVIEPSIQTTPIITFAKEFASELIREHYAPDHGKSFLFKRQKAETASSVLSL